MRERENERERERMRERERERERERRGSRWAVFVVQLAANLLPTPEIRSSNSLILNFYLQLICFKRRKYRKSSWEC